VYAVSAIAIFFTMLAVAALAGTFRSGLAAFAFFATWAVCAVIAIAIFLTMLAVAALTCTLRTWFVAFALVAA